ncbi:MAG: type II toxin-antitoxin system MqsA family antitoxin [Deltaproteobacteria bacterium]|nr:type II toxin-antitoxin system MqsA family antitoxin [Deltaproteobacteria bacterium]
MNKPKGVCPACGGNFRRGTRPVEFTYQGEVTTIRQPGWYCTKCGEGVHDGADIKATDRAFMEFKAVVDGVLAPTEVRHIREKLHLSQRLAGQILGGGPRAFQKYESGTAAVSQPMSNLLRLLRKDPKRLAEISVSPKGKHAYVKQVG